MKVNAQSNVLQSQVLLVYSHRGQKWRRGIEVLSKEFTP